MIMQIVGRKRAISDGPQDHFRVRSSNMPQGEKLEQTQKKMRQVKKPRFARSRKRGRSDFDQGAVEIMLQSASIGARVDRLAYAFAVRPQQKKTPPGGVFKSLSITTGRRGVVPMALAGTSSDA